MVLEVSALTVFVALVAGSLVAWRRLFRDFKQGMQPLPPRLRAPSPFGLLDVLLMFFAWIMAQLLGLELAKWLAGLESDSLSDLPLSASSYFILVAGTVQLVATFGCIVIYRMRYPSPPPFTTNRQTTISNIRIGLLGFLLIVPPTLILQMVLNQLVPYKHDTLESLKEATSSLPIVTAWIMAVVIAPIVEEIFFRGMLQGWLQRLGNTRPEDFDKLISGGRFNSSQNIDDEQWQTKPAQPLDDSNTTLDDNPYHPPESSSVSKTANQPDVGEQVYFDSKLRWTPILVSAGLFAAAHIGQGAAPIPLFFLAIGLGYLYRQTGSIVPGIVVHFLLNFHSMFWATLAVFFDAG